MSDQIIIDYGLGKLDAESKKKVEKALREIFNKVDVLSLDRNKTRALEAELQKVAKTFGTALTTTIRNSLSNDIVKTIRMNGSGNKTYKDSKNISDWGSIGTTYREGKTSVSGKRGTKIGWDTSEFTNALSESLQGFGYTADEAIKIIRNLNKEMTFLATDMKTKSFTLGLNSKDGTRLQVTGEALFDKKTGVTTLGKPMLSSTMASASDLSASAAKEYEHNLRLIKQYEQQKGKEKEIAKLKKRNLELEKQLTKTQLKKFQYIKKQAEATKQTKKQKEIETKEQKQQNKKLQESLQLLNKIHKLRMQYINNSDKSTHSELFSINEKEISKIESQINANKKLLTQEQKQTLEAKAQALAEERTLAAKQKELKLISRRNTRGNLLDEVGTAMQRVAIFSVAYQAKNIFQNVLTQSIATVTKFDKYMTQLTMVTQNNNVSIKSLTKSYIELAKELGATSEAVINAADLWLRQGRSIAETNELIRATMIMSNVAAIDSAQSADILTSAINGFKLEAKDAMHVVDVFASVDLAAAANTEELAEAMQRVAATAGEVGVSFENITAYIGTLVDATRIAPETIGSALNTILSRLQNIKLGSMVSDEGESLSDAQKALAQVGIELFDVNGSFKEMDVVLGELASKWQSLNDVEKSSIAYAVAGTRQRNVFLQLMNNWEKSVYLSAVALNSEGAALQKQEVYMSSYEASVNRLSTSWDKFLNTTNADAFKNINNFLTKVLDLTNALNFSVGDLFASLTAVLAIFKGEQIGKIFAHYLPKNRRAAKMESAVSQLEIKDDSVREAVKEVALLGQKFEKTTDITKKLTGEAGKLEIVGGKATRAEAARLKIYNQSNLTTEQAIAAEKALATARGQTAKASFGSKLIKGIGAAILVKQISEALIGGVASLIDSWTTDATERVQLKRAEIQGIGEEINKISSSTTKSNLDMLNKIATQVGEDGITEELQSEIQKITETLNKNLNVSKSILKEDENGNQSLRSLEELVADYEQEIANQTFTSFMSGRETLISSLNSQLKAQDYKAFDIVQDGGKWASDLVSNIAGGSVGGSIIGGVPGAIIGGVVGLFTGLFGDKRTVGGVGESVTIEEAIAKTEENYKNALKDGNAELISQLKDSLDQLKEIKTTLDEQVEILKEDYSSNLQMYTSAVGKNSIASTDVAMIQSIVDVVAKELSLEQLASEDTYNLFQKGIKDMVKDLQGADTKLSYTEFYKTFEQGGYFASLLGENTSALRQIGTIIAANGPTLASAASALRKALEEDVEKYKQQINSTQKRSELLNSLSTLGFDAGMSGEQVLSLLNIGGAVNTSGIIDPSLRAYAKELSNLYEEYWGEDGKIANASYLEDQEKLGEEYERAVSLKQKEYEILKKQLEVQKAQNNLSEAKRERDTLVFRNGRFMYEANPNTIKQLTEEKEKLEKEMEQLEVQSAIEANTNAQLDHLSHIQTAAEKIVALLEGDVASNALKIQESIGEDIQKDIADGIIDNPLFYMLYQQIAALSPDYQAKLAQLGLFANENDEFIAGLTGISPFDKGGLLQGKGLFSKQTSRDEVVLSATDAPKILSLLSRTGEFQNTVLQADNLLKSLSVKNGKFSNLLAQNSSNNIIYNINNVNVEEANDIQGILYSASEIVKTSNPKFIKG